MACIWGFFFFVLFGANQTEAVPVMATNFEEIEVNDTIEFKALDLAYSDPFLKRKIVPVGGFSGGVSLNAANRYLKPKRPIAPNKPVIKEVKILWPKIEYGGTVNNIKGLIKINNRLTFMQENDEAEEVKLLSLTPDSIRVSFQKEEKVILKNR